MRKQAIGLVGFLITLTACGSGQGGGGTATPTATIIVEPSPVPQPTRTATPTATATVEPSPGRQPTTTATPVSVTTYRLTDGSVISFTPPAGDLVATAPEPLSGTFVVEPEPFPPPTPIVGNAYVYGVITALSFQSAHFSVTGNSGSLAVITIYYPGQLAAQAFVQINGTPVSLLGMCPLSIICNALNISGLQLSGDGYSLTIYATSDTAAGG